jgi:ATP-dependent helicase/nuclease subunit A
MSARVFTAQQQAAIDTLDRNLLVNAGAGSGKTAVLVERFVTLLARPEQSGIESVSQIVAITFTTRAAQEMRARVRDRLNDRLAQAASDEERGRWARHLTAFDGARISTIHALAAALLRANAADLDSSLDPAFEVLDEAQSGLLAEAAIEDVLRATAHDDPSLALFAEYTADEVHKSVRNALRWPLAELPDDLPGHWKEAQAALWQRQRPALLEQMNVHLDGLPPAGVPQDDRRWQACAEACAARDLLLRPDSGWDETFARVAAIDLRGGAKKAWGEDAFGDAGARLKAARDLVHQAAVWLGEPVTDDPTSADGRAAALTRCWHRLITRAQTRYAALKQARNAVDFDDLEGMALALLHKPAVRARYDGAEFRHVMVDEFQDTSETQWQIVQRLANPARPGALFLVGDPKQSIYGFRGADARVFAQARRTLEAHGGQTIALNRSFRTHEGLVAQFNGLFEALFIRDDAHPAAAWQTIFSAEDAMSAERQISADSEPALEFLFADKADATDSEDSGRAREAAAVAERIQALAAAGRDYGDIALLFRATASMPIYEEAFKEAQIPYVTVAGRGYYNRQEVWDVLALLRALIRPGDALNLAVALRSPLFNLSDDALLALRLAAGADVPPLWEALASAAEGRLPGFPPAEREAAQFAHAALTELRADAGRVPLAELLERALARTGYRALLSALPDGERRRGNLDKLVSKAADAGALSLGAFLDDLADLTERETREGEAVVDVSGAVQLMTIHAAKGLEFPVVFVTDAGRGHAPGKPALLLDETMGLAVRLRRALPGSDLQGRELPQSFACAFAGLLHDAKEEAELRRLLYVAATRAKDHLLISAAVRQKKDGTIGAEKGLLALLGPVIDFDGHLFLTGADAAAPALFGGPANLRYHREPRPRRDTRPIPPWPSASAARVHTPALLQPLDADPWAVARSLSATTMAELGLSRLAQTADEREQWQQRWRSRVLYAAPTPLDPVTTSTGSTRYQRLLGEVVHKALRWCPPDASDGQMKALVEQLVWEASLFAEANTGLVGDAVRLLRRTLDSPLQRELMRARRVYRELPFVLHTGQRAIHGVIDVLYEQADGGWALVDYKTALVKDAHSEAALEHHAAQYHFQLAVYAAAVRDLLAPPDLAVYIHYIQHDCRVRIAGAVLTQALEQLETVIGQMCAEDAPA